LQGGGVAQKKRVANRAKGGGDGVLSLEQLSRFANIMGASLETSILVEDAIEPLMSLVGAEGLMIALTDETDRFLQPTANTNCELSPRAKGLPINAVASLGTEAVAFDSGAALPESLADHLGEVDDPMILMPLWAHGRVRGLMLLRRRGEPFTTSSIKLLTAAGRQFAMAVENSRLLSELQVSYRDLMDTQEELIRAERLAAMGQLAATMAHEIRNPLATIFSAISQIRKHSKADGVSATLLDIAEEETARMNTMVGGLLDFARPRKPSFEVRRPLEIAREVVKAALEADGAPEGIRIAVDPSSDDPELPVDPELILRGLQRLVENAIKAIEGSGEITLRVRRGDGAKIGAIIEVEDSGCGIPREQLSHVLEPFFSTRPSGIGLGLPTARRIAEDHGGTLEISSEAGRGTTVRLLLGAKARSKAGAEKTV
jgi:signal transduction histidine kinase